MINHRRCERVQGCDRRNRQVSLPVTAERQQGRHHMHAAWNLRRLSEDGWWASVLEAERSLRNAKTPGGGCGRETNPAPGCGRVPGAGGQAGAGRAQSVRSDHRTWPVRRRAVPRRAGAARHHAVHEPQGRLPRYPADGGFRLAHDRARPPCPLSHPCEAKAAVCEYLEVFYKNRQQRLHSGLGCRTPAEARRASREGIAMRAVA